MLLTRLFESLPLTCPNCGADMRIVAFRDRDRPGAADPHPHRRACRTSDDCPCSRTSRLGRLPPADAGLGPPRPARARHRV
jgi:hypothetical protein